MKRLVAILTLRMSISSQTMFNRATTALPAALLFAGAVIAQQSTSSKAATGQAEYDRNCATCHGGDGLGGEMGPSIASRLTRINDAALDILVRDGIPARGMPAFPNMRAEDKGRLFTFLRSIRPRRGPAPVHRTLQLTTNESLAGMVMNESPLDLQMRTDDGRLAVLRREGDGFRRVTSQADWLSYNGDTRGYRYSGIAQITKSNVAKLAPKWIFTMEGSSTRSQTTPVVMDGIMYVTSGNECWALDAGAGREIWHFQRPRTQGLAGNAAQGFNRGVAALGGRVFMVTDHAHLLALNRFTGQVEWDTEMADWHKNYNATSAPLLADGLVISGTAGGEQGARGFIAAFDPESGKEVWRFWTVPSPGEPGSETWKGKAYDHPSGVAWLTGSFDPAAHILYWATGNPGPDYNGEERAGDNLFTCSILALDPKTGKLRWHYQTTPHDTHDWDATEPLSLIDARWQGQPRRLLVQANRNGFFYVLDRLTGKLLLAEPFVRNINWAKSVGPDGRPALLALPKAGTGTGEKVCPSQDGATNWYSTAFDPGNGYYLVQTLEKCSIYNIRQTEEWQAGMGYAGGSQRGVPNEVPQQILRAIDFRTGKIAWEMPEVGPASSWGGLLSLSSGVGFLCGDGGMFTAFDVSDGKPLWYFQTGTQFKASPMTYVFDNKQYIAIASGQNIVAFSE